VNNGPILGTRRTFWIVDIGPQVTGHGLTVAILLLDISSSLFPAPFSSLCRRTAHVLATGLSNVHTIPYVQSPPGRLHVCGDCGFYVESHNGRPGFLSPKPVGILRH
jgi:hypothetical protein